MEAGLGFVMGLDLRLGGFALHVGDEQTSQDPNDGVGCVRAVPASELRPIGRSASRPTSKGAGCGKFLSDEAALLTRRAFSWEPQLWCFLP